MKKGIALTVFLVIIIYVIKLFVMEPKGSILYEMYKEQNPSVVNGFFRYVPDRFKKTIKIEIIEKFNGNELICTEENYGFPYYRVFIRTKDNQIFNFKKESVGINLRYNFNVDAFNYYLTNKFVSLDSAIVVNNLFKFLNGKCGENSLFELNSQNDINEILRKYPTHNTRDLQHRQLNFNDKKDCILVWHRKIGILKVSYTFNSNFTVSKLSILRLGSLGNEVLDL